MPPTRSTINAGNAAKRAAVSTKGPWSTWRKSTRHAQAIRFIETYCRAPKGQGHGQPLKLAPFQKEFLEAALAKDVSAAILACPRGNGKSSFLGAFLLWSLFMDDDTGSPQIPVVSTTISQSLKACYGVAEAMCRAEQELSSRAIIYTGVSTPRIATPHNGGLLFPLADTVDGLQGLDCSAAVLDEIGFSSMETFSSLMLAGGKRARSLLIGTGTPGLDRDNALFALRERMHSGRPMPGVVWHEYSAPDNCIVTDRAVWRKANPAIEAGFLREDALEQALALVPEAHFRIFRLGQFGIDGVESWLGEDGRAVWNASQFNYDFVPGERTWCGLDVGLKRDSTALVSVQFMPDGRLHAKAKIWLPKSDEPVDLQDIMAEIRKLHETYKVEAIAYDPKMFELAAQELYDEGIKMVEFPQSLQRMQPAVGKLYEQVRNNQVTHPHDEGFTQQVLNAVPRLQDGGFTLSKGKSRGRIDAAVALALAVDRALHKKKARALYVA